MQAVLPHTLRATGSGRDLLLVKDFYSAVCDLLRTPQVQALKEYTHHRYATRFQHSLNVAYYSFLLCRKFGLDARAAARAGLLHDLYFYDTRQYRRASHRLGHAKFHPMAALENAGQITNISNKERDMILNHMWPLAPERPGCAETWMLTLMDKYCAMLEFLVLLPVWNRN